MRWLALAVACLAAAPVRAAELPIFDAHVHYSAPDWTVFGAEHVLAVLHHGGVRRAIVSSTPDEGTHRLLALARDRVIPFLRPYRTREDMGTWHGDPAIAAYVERELGRGVYHGIGEFHVYGDDVAGPTVRRVAELAAARGLYLHAHTDAAGAARLLALYPTAKLLWAHAGMSASPAEVGALLDRSPTLIVELALRYGDIAPDGRLDPEWRVLLVRHADRLLLGTDTWVTSRWTEYVSVQSQARAWLSQLPADVAEKIAHRNGERLFPAR